jgi:hypothetical protein
MRKAIIDLNSKDGNQIVTDLLTKKFEYIANRLYDDKTKSLDYDSVIKGDWDLLIVPTYYINLDKENKFLISDLASSFNDSRTRIVNHYPNPSILTDKLQLTNLAQQKGYDFYPKSYILSKDTYNQVEELISAFSTSKTSKGKRDSLFYLTKPYNEMKGSGIKFHTSLDSIVKQYDIEENKDTFFVQKYISNPLLYKGRKFDIRIHALLDNEGNIYINKYGHIKTSSFKYKLPTGKNDKTERLIHLTNNYVQSQNKETFGKYEEGNILIPEDFDFYEKAFPEFARIVKQVITDSQLYENRLKSSITNEVQFYEFFGFDFMLDENYKVWLLEVNLNPGYAWHNRKVYKRMKEITEDMFKIVLSNSANYRLCKSNHEEPKVPTPKVLSFKILG